MKEKIEERISKNKSELETLNKIRQEHIRRIQESQNALNTIEVQMVQKNAKIEELADILKELIETV